MKLSFSCLLLLCSTLQSADYYVATDGSDSNTGTINSPFATIAKAAEYLAAGDNCFLRAGKYHESVIIDGLNGSPAAPITFTNYNGEQVILDGTIALDNTWTLHEGAIYKQTLALDIWQLFIDEQEQVMARWPNANFIEQTVWDQKNNWAWGNESSGSNGTMVDEPNGSVSLAASGLDMTGAMAIVNVGSFKTWARKVVEHRIGLDRFGYDPVPTIAYRTKHHYYFLEGKLNLLDANGEWYYDPATKVIYAKADDGGALEGRDIRGKTQTYAFDISNSNYIHIKGFEFFATTVKFDGSDHVLVEDCEFLYPSTSKRMLGDTGMIEATLFKHSKMANSFNIVRRCSFEYTDGSAIEMYGRGNTIEDCYFYHIDYTCAAIPFVGTSITMHGIRGTFRHNTVHRTGASSMLNPGDSAVVELNNLYDSGYLQSDGALIHCMVPQQTGVEISRNWLHDTPKYGIRFDGQPGGMNGLVHHNVAWNTQGGLMIKGDRHFIYNNAVFNNTEKNDIIILSDAKFGGNNSTKSINNAATKMAGHRKNGLSAYPLPGQVFNNWNGYEENKTLESQLANPEGYDFRPKTGSGLTDRGRVIAGITNDYKGAAPDIGAYESGEEYWIPGVTWGKGVASVILSSVEVGEKLPSHFELEQNYPNPFNLTTRIRFTTSQASSAILTVYSITGRLVDTIADTDVLPGSHYFDWDASAHSSGIYIITLQTIDGIKSRKTLLLK